ncbi:MAG: ATP-binding protein [Promethearchaeati archaeon SRVP18_Atabeyarchaeia-1]
MSWIVITEDKGKIMLVSKSNQDDAVKGILHRGSYLTVEDGEKKFILRVEDSSQFNPYSPSPMVVDMDLSPLLQDQKCQNVVYATKIVEHPDRDDGRSSFIRPQLLARVSNQSEIDAAFGNNEGIPVFPATTLARSCKHLRDDKGKLVQVKIPEDVFFYQMLVTGSTGSGKTVAMKYMAQYFVEELKLNGRGPGAVLAVNVKEEDMLTMDRPSESGSSEVMNEWSDLHVSPHGVETFRTYYPGNLTPRYSKAVDLGKCEKITLETDHIDPETLTGLIQNITELGADQLPAIFRYWKEKIMKRGEKLGDFIRYFADPNKNRDYTALNSRGEELPIRMHPGTFQSVLNALSNAAEYFDVRDAKELNAKDILEPGKMSVIDVTAKHGFGFGAVLLRDLLDKIFEAKSRRETEVPALIIIDEVHEFYGSARSREALYTLDAICRKGRSLEIGVIFASQNPEDMPKGIVNVVNTKIGFKSDSLRGIDPEALKPGYGIAKVHGLSQLNFVKFPLSLGGVSDGRRANR